MIVVYGTVCLDLLHRVDFLPQKGGYAEITEEVHMLGGEAANTAASLVLWGADTTLVGNPIGQGAQADLLAALLRQHRLGQALLPHADHTAPVCHIFVTPDGERTMFGRGFAEMERRCDPALAPLQAGSWFTADPNHGRKAREAIALASKAGMNVYLLDFVRDDETVPVGAIWQSSTAWVGRFADAQHNCDWVSRWLERHDCFGILTDGVNGFVAGSREYGVHKYQAVDIPDSVDSTGAGDMFRAGVLFGLAAGWEIAQCFTFASTAAAFNCTKLGAIGGLESKQTIDAFLADHPEVAGHYESAKR